MTSQYKYTVSNIESDYDTGFFMQDKINKINYKYLQGTYFLIKI